MHTTESRKIQQAARALLGAGFEPIPIAPGKKYPTLKNWPAVELPIDPWPKDHGIGIRTGTITGIDIDVYYSDVVEHLLTAFTFDHLTRVGQAPKTLVPLLCPEITEKITSNKWTDEHGVIQQIECLSYGQQFVAYGIHPGTGKHYQWSGDFLDHDLPIVSPLFIKSLFSILDELAADKGWINITVKEQQARATHKSRKSGSKPDKTGNKPGALYNRCCLITDVLQEYGWQHYRGQYWTRPGKKYGVSGTVFDDQTFWCFTSSTCLEPGRSYDNFGLLTMYEYAGDFAAAARALHRTMREVA